MGAPQTFESSYDTKLPEHVQQELTSRHEAIMVVADKHPFLVGMDFVWPYVKGPVVSFLLLALVLGLKPAWDFTWLKLKPKR